MGAKKQRPAQFPESRRSQTAKGQSGPLSVRITRGRRRATEARKQSRPELTPDGPEGRKRQVRSSAAGLRSGRRSCLGPANAKPAPGFLRRRRCRCRKLARPCSATYRQSLAELRHLADAWALTRAAAGWPAAEAWAAPQQLVSARPAAGSPGASGAASSCAGRWRLFPLSFVAGGANLQTCKLAEPAPISCLFAS